MKRQQAFAGFLVASLLAAASGCGGSVTTTGAAGDGGTGGAGGSGGAGAAGGGGTGGSGGSPACPDFQGQSSPAEIAKSPFANAEAEVLAIEASGKLVAPEAVYQRIILDLSAIRGTNSQLQNISAMSSWVPDELLVGFDPAGIAAVKAGSYTGWDCPNAYYGMNEKMVSTTYVQLRFSHRFNAPLLAKDYAGLPNVEYAEPNGFGGDGNDVCVSIDGETTYHYIFDEGSGDCPAGCIEHTYWGFTTKASQVITPLGTFTKSQGSPPSWFTALGECTKWL